MTRAHALPVDAPKQFPSSRLAAEALSLPIFPELTREQQVEVVAALTASSDLAL